MPGKENFNSANDAGFPLFAMEVVRQRNRRSGVEEKQLFSQEMPQSGFQVGILKTVSTLLKLFGNDPAPGQQ